MSDRFQKIKKSKTLKNLISKKKIEAENEKEDESEKKHMRKVLNMKSQKDCIILLEKTILFVLEQKKEKNFIKNIWDKK